MDRVDPTIAVAAVDLLIPEHYPLAAIGPERPGVPVSGLTGFRGPSRLQSRPPTRVKHLVQIGTHADIRILLHQLQRAVAGHIEPPGGDLFHRDLSAPSPQPFHGIIGGTCVQYHHLVRLSHRIHPTVHKLGFVFANGVDYDLHAVFPLQTGRGGPNALLSRRSGIHQTGGLKILNNLVNGTDGLGQCGIRLQRAYRSRRVGLPGRAGGASWSSRSGSTRRTGSAGRTSRSGGTSSTRCPGGTSGTSGSSRAGSTGSACCPSGASGSSGTGNTRCPSSASGTSGSGRTGSTRSSIRTRNALGPSWASGSIRAGNTLRTGGTGSTSGAGGASRAGDTLRSSRSGRTSGSRSSGRTGGTRRGRTGRSSRACSSRRTSGTCSTRPGRSGRTGSARRTGCPCGTSRSRHRAGRGTRRRATARRTAAGRALLFPSPLPIRGKIVVHIVLL